MGYASASFNVSFFKKVVLQHLIDYNVFIGFNNFKAPQYGLRGSRSLPACSNLWTISLSKAYAQSNQNVVAWKSPRIASPNCYCFNLDQLVKWFDSDCLQFFSEIAELEAISVVSVNKFKYFMLFRLVLLFNTATFNS